MRTTGPLRVQSLPPDTRVSIPLLYYHPHTIWSEASSGGESMRYRGVLFDLFGTLVAPYRTREHQEIGVNPSDQTTAHALFWW